MKTWKRIALALGIVAVLGGATAAIAANAHRRGNFQQRITGRVNHMLDKINATPEQRQKINDIVNQAMTDLKAQRQANAPMQLATAPEAPAISAVEWVSMPKCARPAASPPTR